MYTNIPGIANMSVTLWSVSVLTMWGLLVSDFLPGQSSRLELRSVDPTINLVAKIEKSGSTEKLS